MWCAAGWNHDRSARWFGWWVGRSGLAPGGGLWWALNPSPEANACAFHFIETACGAMGLISESTEWAALASHSEAIKRT